MENLTGKVIRGYELHDLIGEGGFGSVYKAVQTIVDREVAIKIILPQYANRPEFIRRFEAEAKLVARLEHIHIVSLYDYWRDPSGAYLVLRWLRGGTLKSYMEEQGGALTPRRAARVFGQIAAALSTAHRANVVHRDVKPANILLDEDGNAYLSDFGIAMNSLEEKEVHTQLSSESSLTGSAGYISPEQINMEPITARSDIYSMTLVLYEMLSGHHPYPDARSSIALFIKHTNEPLPILENYPEEINAILQKGSAKKSEDRYEDILEMASDLRNAIIETGVVSAQGGEGTMVDDFDTSTFMRAAGVNLDEIQNPYKGLQAFQETDAEDFFGRENLTEEILGRMEDGHDMERFLAVVGPSGSGKSSVVKAGIIPKLRDDVIPGSADWFYVEMVPGLNPMVEMEEALVRISANPIENLYETLMSETTALRDVITDIIPLASEILIVIDQFEEVFTQGNESVRTHFLESLYEAVIDKHSKLRVIITLRADFYDRPLAAAKFGTLIQQRTIVVLPLSVDEMERAITAPARGENVFFQQGLPAQIVSEVVDQPGVLPMLQYALTELFERRDGQLLMTSTYNEIGGVLGALARRAEEIYLELDEAQQEATRQMFLRLVSLGEGTEDTRRRTLQTELLAAADEKSVMQGVIDTFSVYRLLTTDRDPVTRSPTVEVAHEALIREWQRLRDWLDEAREDVRLQRMLSVESQEWDENHRDVAYLLRGGRLVQFEDWAEETTVALTQVDRDFIGSSIAERERLEEEERQQVEKQRELEKRAQRILQAFLVGAVIALIVAVGLAFVAFQQSVGAQNAKGTAEAEADNAATQQVIAQEEAERASTQQVVAEVAAEEADQARSTAVIQVTDVARARATSEAAANINATQVVIAELAQADAVDQANFASTQQVIAQNQANNAATQQANAESAAIEADQARSTAVIQVTAVAAARATSDFNANSNATQVVVAELAQADALEQANFAATQQVIAQNQANNAATQQAVAESAANRAATQEALAVNEANRAATQEALAVNEANRAATQEVLAVSEANRAATQQVVAEDEARRAATQEALAVNEASRAATQEAVAVGAQANAETQRQIAEQEAEESRSLALAGSANELLYQDSPLSLYLAIQANQDISNPTSLARRILSQAVLSAPRRRINVGEPLTTVHFLPVSDDGHLRAIVGTMDGAVETWDVTTGEKLQELNGHEGPVTDLAINPVNSNIVVSSSSDGSVIVWNLTNGTEQRRFVDSENSFPINAIDINASGTRVVAGCECGTVSIWNLGGGLFKALPQVSNNSVNSVVYRPDTSGDIVIAFDDAVRYWDEGISRYIQFDLGDIFARLVRVQSLAFGPDPEYVLTSQSDVGNRPQLWEIDVDNTDITENVVQPLRVAYPEQLGQINHITYSHDGLIVLSSAADGTAFLSWASNGQLIRRLDAHIAPVSASTFSADDQLVLTAGEDGFLYLWDVNPSIGEQDVYDGLRFSISHVEFNEAGNIFAGSDRGRVAFWDRDEFEAKTSTLLVDSLVPQFAYKIYRDEEADRDLLLVGSLDMRLFDMNTNELLRTFEHEEELAFVNNLTFSRDGTQVIWAGGFFTRVESRDALAREFREPILRVWDRETGDVAQNIVLATDETTIIDTDEEGESEEVVITQQVDNSFTAIATHPDGIRIAAGDEYGNIRIWNITNGELIATLAGHTDLISTMQFSDDGTLLLSGSSDRIVILWDAETYVPIRRFVGHSDRINDVDFSPVDSTFVSVSEDRSLLLWDAATGELLQGLGVQTEPVTTAEFTPDGTGILFGTLDGRVMLVGVANAQEIIEWALENRYIPELSPAQLQQYNIASSN